MYGRVFALWSLTLSASGLLALVDSNPQALWIAALLLPLAPLAIGRVSRFILALIGVCTLMLGPQVLLIGIPIVFAVVGLNHAALMALGALTSTALLYPQFQTLPESLLSGIPLASFVFLVVPAWVTLFVFFKTASPQSRATLFFLPIIFVLVLNLVAESWMEPNFFTSNFVRVILSLFPVLLAGWFGHLSATKTISIRLVAISIFVGAIAVTLAPVVPVTHILFDEAHGKWETVQSSFGPEDFGRAANYTYSQLFEKARRLVGQSSIFASEKAGLPSTNSIFVIKMPAEPLSVEFSRQLAEWVDRGGRLLVVADHTDLYDTTQHINTFVSKYFGVRINTDATYDALGMPTEPITELAGALLGRINAHGQQFSWQTGASLQRMPFSTIELATFGRSFAENGDYSRPNRFGPFVPKLTNRYFNHSAAIALPYGRGAIAVLLDSTPWSNFSIFKAQYSQLFNGIVGALEHPFHLSILSGVAIALGLLAIVAVIAPTKLVAMMIGICWGAAISAGIAVGSTSWINPQYGKDFGLKVAIGPEAKLEFLKQRLLPGERNYSRIISSLGKYGLMPSTSIIGSTTPHLKESKRWLLIEPTAAQLPGQQVVLDHLKRGGDIVILFSPEQAISSEILSWLSGFSLVTQRSIGLSVNDAVTGVGGSLFGERSPALARELRVMTTPKSTSILNTYSADQLLQTYTLRPTKLPRESGLMTIGFSSDQFTDDAVGDVWEGIYPSSLGRLRERQLAATILGEERPSMMPDWLVRAQRKKGGMLGFLVLENGAKKLSGKFGIASEEDTTTGYLRALRDQATGFVINYCPPKERITQCSSRLLSEDMVEWMVSWQSGSDGKIAAIELLHERRMSGLGATWNVLFGK